jgi:hypothetical protein
MPHGPNLSPRLTLPDEGLTQHKNAQQSLIVVVEHPQIVCTGPVQTTPGFRQLPNLCPTCGPMV